MALRNSTIQKTKMMSFGNKGILKIGVECNYKMQNVSVHARCDYYQFHDDQILTDFKPKNNFDKVV